MAPDETAFGPTRPSSPDATAGLLVPGGRVGNYVIREPLSAGGFGTVYRAEHRVLGRVVALKVMHAELAGHEEYVMRFEREARAVNTIGHPNIVDIHEFGSLADGRPYFVMELVDGDPLDELIGDRGALSVDDALAILEPLCDAVAAAHEHGILHRDIKASNVMIASDRVVLLDFGIAKLLGDNAIDLTRTGQIIGTPACMAPEQLTDSPVDERADVYALAVLAFHMLSGRPPFTGDDPAVLHLLHRTAERPRLSASAPVRPAIDRAITRAMAVEPAERPATVRAFFAELSAAAGGEVATDAAGDLVAVYLTSAARADDDATLDAVDELLEQAREAMESGGFELVVDTGNAILLVARELSPEVVRDAIVAYAGGIDDRLRATARPAFCLHVGDLAGGELGRIARWTPAEPIEGVVATARFADRIGAGAEVDDGFVRLAPK